MKKITGNKNLLLALIGILTMLPVGNPCCQAGDTSFLPVSTVVILDLTKRNKETGIEVVALKQCFDITGISYIITEDLKEAVKYKLIYTAGSLFNATFSPVELQTLFAFVETGGTLVSALIGGNRYYTLFGIDQPVDSRKRYQINFKDSSADAALKYIDRKEERSILLGNKNLFPEIIWTHSYEVRDAASLGSTEDGKNVFSVNEFGEGLAYAFGLAYSDVILLPHIGGDYEAQRSWINEFEPGSDVFMLILKGIFEKTFETQVYLSAIPYGFQTALLLSHDVDAQSSFRNSIDYALLENRFGFRSTFFITTKYFSDETDIGYYNPIRSGYVKNVKELGGDIGSHSVSHSRTFNKLILGDENINLAGYRPLSNPTVFGELKVSKEILDKDLPGQDTIVFRAGELRVPDGLFEALEKSGYKFDSSFSANDNMVNFAYRALKRRNIGAEESSIVEIPVTFDDSQGFLNESNMDVMVRKWFDVIWANADNEAISTLLIHPTETGYKLKTEEKLLSSLQGRDIWIGDIGTYADFWNRRFACRYKAFINRDKLIIRLLSGAAAPDISFAVKYPGSIKSVEVQNSNGQRINFLEIKRGDHIFLRNKQ